MKAWMTGAAALATMGLAMVPGAAMAATDGTAGTTSTGTFNASLQVNAPAGTTVQVIGLDDFTFPAVTGGITTNTPVPSIEQPFCLLRSTPGNVLVTITQAGVSGGYNLESGANSISLGINVITPGGGSITGTSNGNTFQSAPSNGGCTASSSAATAHVMSLAPGTVLAQNAGQAYGSFSGVFQVLVAAE